MPGLPEPTAAEIWRKRKRDEESSRYVDLYLQRNAMFTPTLLTHPSSTAFLPWTDQDQSYNPAPADISFRPRCLPRKRRNTSVNTQPPYLSIPQQNNTLLSPNVYATPHDPYSPPVSPKTLVPIPYPAGTSTTAPTSNTMSAAALRPCHICHRRPATRSVLDAYADCDLCSERACFICLRLCDGENCSGAPSRSPDLPDLYSPGEELDLDLGFGDRPRRKICSRCAVESVTETGLEIVRCLDCMRNPQPSVNPWKETWDGDVRMCG
ncbi:hypothetical protein N7532_000105 [Penicillium argentinense]|uniref:Uncharacterized protein n=1 Tax=Penicillium argentinense TaxID=1131581 RepID=A0A9W9G4L5_9EURO|nr:uncharacterized protein N7532_000105 [Penicillium argentinense]KAJ5112060.1 hypothetical protein N7532_000105 [Penicillium argentinense]